MIRTPLGIGEFWLDNPAAFSFARMIEAGMPRQTVASAGRTREEQTELYRAWQAGVGNLAAKPGTSLHEVGNAVDMTRGKPAQLWMTEGGDPWQVKAGERLRCHEYGWRRTVPSEAWHFSYDASLDKHRPTSGVAWTHRVVNCTALNVRAGAPDAGRLASVVGSLTKGARLRLTGEFAGAWARIQAESGLVGWVNVDYLEGITK